MVVRLKVGSIDHLFHLVDDPATLQLAMTTMISNERLPSSTTSLRSQSEEMAFIPH